MNDLASMNQPLLDAILRTDLPSFVRKVFRTVEPGYVYLHNWHVDALCYRLQQCLDGIINRLIITVPPRSLKSVCTSVAFPAFVLGQDPTRRVICVSYANELTAKHARDCRTVVQSNWYQRVFPGTRINPKKNAELEFETTKKGYRYGTSLGGALTGRGGNFIIIDDPIKPGDALSEVLRKNVNDWFDGTLLSRLNDKQKDVIILVMQRVHEDDLVGHLLAKESGWVHLDLPAIAEEDQSYPLGAGAVHLRKKGDVLHPEREPKEVLERLKADMGSFAFAAQYQQRPVPVEGNLIKWEWFKTFEQMPAHNADGRIVQSWDTASKAGELNDYSVCTTWLMKGKDYYLLDVLRERLDYPRLKKRVMSHAHKFAAHFVLVEDKGSGTQLIQELRWEVSKLGARMMPIDPQQDKVVRMSYASAPIEDGHVYLPKSAPWMEVFKKELLAFPYGKFDDQADSFSQFLGWAIDRGITRVRSGRTIGMI